MRVEVTAEDLACGWNEVTASASRLCTVCPIEHAATRAMGEKVQSNGEAIWFQRVVETWHHAVPLPPVALEAVKMIDRGRKVEPFSFDIVRPRA